MPAGRPSIYTQKLADQICERIADGESMRSISRDEKMPCMNTLFKWLREREDFVAQYAIAKDDAADSMVEDILLIADNEDQDVQRSKLMVDTRKWIASKLKPKKYGDRIHNEHSGNLTLTHEQWLQQHLNEQPDKS